MLWTLYVGKPRYTYMSVTDANANVNLKKNQLFDFWAFFSNRMGVMPH